MNIPASAPLWRFMAIVEVDAAVNNLAGLRPKEGPRFQLTACHQSPRGYAWYELAVDGAAGEQAAIRNAHVVLRALERLATDVLHTDMRIVSGAEWLEQARNLRRA
ncbi:MAG TPA: hypothetical protein VMR06_00615 [Dokdonella sp.]|uniref:hypothetical protein n=1 Tax=Dokdonella sp. TaxID=2291710 RepID=UPI002C327CDD|nr:hypothetical protein [Dokdonella sp.]HUD40483.1 hypothetical protein [Dokdonella sp.]